ncbi:MAG: thiamine diphosphokinase, partial [Patescibacteria group bacterium]|nr:thiamine diphosphokinase [Patescibacteria group bacterium]
MHAVVFSGGNVESGIAVYQSLKKADLVIAADSGAEAALAFGVTPSYVLGDFDSLSQETKK